MCAAPPCQLPDCCCRCQLQTLLLFSSRLPCWPTRSKGCYGRWLWLSLCIHPSGQWFHLGVGYSERFWFPVWLEEVDVECPCPVLEDAFLGDEAVVAALAAPLVGKVHCALVRSQRFIVMIRYWKMIRIPVFSSLPFKKVIKLKHLVARNHVHF